MKQHILKTSYSILILSIIVISCGAHLQSNSLQFDMYQLSVMNHMADMHPGDQLAPDLGIGLILASAWPFVGAVQGSIFLFFVAGVLLARKIGTRYHKKGWPFIIVSLLWLGFCLFSSFRYLYIALDSFEWRFYVRGFGEILAAIGLILGAIALLNEVDMRALQNKFQRKSLRAKQTNIL